MTLNRQAVVPAAITAGLVALAAVVGIRLAGGDDQTAGSSAATQSSGSSVSPVSPGGSGSSNAGAPSASTTPSAGSGSTGSTGSAGSGSREMLPTPAAGSTAPGYRLPPRTPSASPTPLVGSTLPPAGNATGALVAGFPAGLAPPARSTIATSSLSVSGGVLQAALVARSAAGVDMLLHYRTVLSALGFQEKPSQGVENDPSALFVHGRDSVSIALHGTRLYLLASLHATRS
jgi:hypothetical protein